MGKVNPSRLEDGTVYTMNEAEGIKSTAKFKEQIIRLM